MDMSDLFSSQESLPLSQESFKYLWQECNENNNSLNELNANDLENCLINDCDFCKIEDGNQPVSSASTSANSKTFTNLNIATSGISTVPEDSTLGESFVENVAQYASSSNIPPSTDWPGDYELMTSFQQQEKTTKSTSWTYSDIKEKLYASMAVPCPVNIHVKTIPPSGSVIRTMAIFSRSEHITDVVKRCLNHSNPADGMNVGHPEPTHLIRCDNSSSYYVEDSVTKRQSVITPYEHPQAGMEYTTYLYRFMCLGSCVGGLNRRPLKLIFTLEKDGCCLGRKVVNLRICACPGRDRKAEEKQIEKQQLKRSSSHLRNNLVISGPPLKRQKTDSDEEGSFTLTVHRRSHYELLKKVKDALELASLLTPEQAAALRQRRCDESTSFVDSQLVVANQSSSNNGNISNNSILSASLESWLFSIGMISYVDTFISYGYNCMEQLSTFREEVSLQGSIKSVLLIHLQASGKGLKDSSKIALMNSDKTLQRNKRK